ncbi:hypothetical protein AVEN_253045-1 [Araneus ventricosus]|uniref:Uncharacterized protein n=1 Tax=Araneus ventricosus TaxID=182803 RepID=A0A4Y2VFV0_ARAVE|nr:hypothetical protein AVEN_253045-1 [Araneus ventricosus]
MKTQTFMIRLVLVTVATAIVLSTSCFILFDHVLSFGEWTLCTVWVREYKKKQLWRNKQNDRPISDSEIKAVLSQLFKTDQWLPPAGHVSEDVTSHA